MIPEEELKIVLIREHYRSRGWDQPLSAHELAAMMAEMKCGPKVIAAHLMIRTHVLNRMIRSGEIAPNVALPIRLLYQTLINGKASPAPL